MNLGHSEPCRAPERFAGETDHSRTIIGARGARGVRVRERWRRLRKRRDLAGIALGWLLVSSVALGCGRFSFSAKEREAFIAEGRRVFTDKNCHGCHTTGPVGTPIAPDLRETAVRYTEAALARWLQNPSAQVPTRHMPDLHLSKAEANAVAAYIVSLR